MARYTGAVCRLCRTEGGKLFLKGDRCFTTKCSVEKRNYWPGMHAQVFRRRTSDYGTQLREAQKMRRTYGLQARQFRDYYEAALSEKGVTGTAMLLKLESRLDNLVYRMGMAQSRAHSRQMVLHGHVLVNGKKVKIPSYECNPGDEISLPEAGKWFKRALDTHAVALTRRVPDWVTVDPDKLVGKYRVHPERSQLSQEIQESLVVEFFSR
jgi:small subunit ribosomal protein S4